MSFSEKLEHESCVANILSERDVMASVSTLRQVCESCIASQISNPVLRLFTSAIQHHITIHSDGAMITATLSLLMTEHALQMSVQQKQSLIVDLFDVIAEAAVTYLMSDECPVRHTIQLDNLSDLLQLLQGVLSTKLVCGMSRADVECIACGVLKIVLSQSSDSSDNIATVLVLGHAVCNSYVQCGTLVKASHLPAYCVISDQQQSNMSLTQPLLTTMTSLLTEPSQRSADGVTIAVYSASLAGSWADADVDVAESVELSSDVNIDKFVMDNLLKATQTVVDCGTGVLACQKVVHPRVKRFLRSRGVLVLDRLGHNIARQLAWQSGAQVITAPFTPVRADQLGCLSDVRHQVISGKSYVCFEGGPHPVHTLVLCAVTEEAGQELRQVSSAARRVLHRALREQAALVGAGVWQKHLAQYVRDLGRQRLVELSERFECHRSDVVNVSECLADSLQRVAERIRPHYHHQQQQQQQQEADAATSSEVLDLLSCCVNGLKTAVSITQSLLKLQFQSNTA